MLFFNEWINKFVFKQWRTGWSSPSNIHKCKKNIITATIYWSHNFAMNLDIRICTSWSPRSERYFKGSAGIRRLRKPDIAPLSTLHHGGLSTSNVQYNQSTFIFLYFRSKDHCTRVLTVVKASEVKMANTKSYVTDGVPRKRLSLAWGLELVVLTVTESTVKLTF